MASDVLSALELDKEDLSGRVIFVKEVPGCEAFFIHSCIMAKQIKQEAAICLVTLHNELNHYHNVGMKMGYNLKNYKEKGLLIKIDCLSMIADAAAKSETLISHGFIDDLFNDVEKAVKDLSLKNKSVCVIVDDLTHFFNLGFQIVDVNNFVQKCRCLINDSEGCSLVVGVHVLSEDDPSHVMAGLLSHMCDLMCEVSGLKTGRSRDVSGRMKITRPWWDTSKTCNSLTKLETYHYKLFDRGIKVFAPGTGR